ncbi:MAG: High-affinity branched-chain amino acid transport ATP-binding protein LivF [bacterium ADurb.Bin429]|nr:MAG: High-affinity branched-chain amino acid transport ATP-binding protein LivF [bacterium ADurb.Bin429]
MLRLTSVVTTYGRTTALHSVSLHVRPGEIVALVGANGAGKTTVLNTISGITPAAKGKVQYGEKDIARMSADRIVRLGISHVPEGRQLFAPLPVKDNLLLGSYTLRHAEKQAHQQEDLQRIYTMFPILKERSEQRAGTLSGGEQQMLAIGRALMARPTLLLLDEPSMGLAPKVMAEIFNAIAEFRNHGLTVLLVEQNARWALKIADRGYVLETGSIVLEGSAEELLENREVQRAYLGKGYREVWE